MSRFDQVSGLTAPRAPAILDGRENFFASTAFHSPSMQPNGSVHWTRRSSGWSAPPLHWRLRTARDPRAHSPGPLRLRLRNRMQNCSILFLTQSPRQPRPRQTRAASSRRRCNSRTTITTTTITTITIIIITIIIITIIITITTTTITITEVQSAALAATARFPGGGDAWPAAATRRVCRSTPIGDERRDGSPSRAARGNRIGRRCGGHRASACYCAFCPLQRIV